jgi:RsbRD-like negative regulator of sigma factor
VQSKQWITEQWLGRVLRTYPCQTAQFLGQEPDPFRNPVGHTLRQALGILLDDVLLAADSSSVAAALDSIVQIRAVQDLTPSRALEFLFQLKNILHSQAPASELALVYARIDELCLQAFDLYMKYREKTYEVRTNEARRKVYVLERRLMPRVQPDWQERGVK